MATAPVLANDDDVGMTDSELASLCAAHEQKAVGYYNSQIAAQQAKAIDYYYGRMDDVPALDGCSQVIDHTVAVMVDNALAAVLKPFVSADEVVSFAPRQSEDVQMAEQATEYVNYVINSDNPGFLILHDWFKDAFLTKIGVVKVWWEDQTQVHAVPGLLNDLELLQARQSEDYLNEQDNGDGTHTVTMRNVDKDGRARVMNVPPEEFLLSPFARSIEEAAYVAHRPSNCTRTDLIEMGFAPEIVDTLPAYSSTGSEESRKLARYRDEEWMSGNGASPGEDDAMDRIGVLDEYVRVDYDGDGIAELRRIVRVDDVILFNEAWEEIPFAILCPVPMPHKVYGISIADQSIEGQKVNTTLTRQTLDNLYKSNNPRPVIGEAALGPTTMDDIFVSDPGAAIRARDASQLTWSVVPFSADKSYSMMEAMAQNTEERTGIQRKGNGFNAEALKKNSPDTATQAAIDENSRNERAEMIARIFAETGVKRLFKLILKLLVAHQPKARVVRLRNQWVPMDPSGWDPEMDLSISVGLGMGNKAEQQAQAQSVLNVMAEVMNTPFSYLIQPEHVHNALKQFYSASGIKNVDDFVADPSEAEPPPPQQDPMMAKVQMEAQAKQFELQMKYQSDQANLQLKLMEINGKLQLSQEDAVAKLQLEQQKAFVETQLAQQQQAYEFQLEQMKIRMDAHTTARKEARADSESDAKINNMRKGGDLNK